MEHEGVKRVCGISGDNATGSEMVGGESRKKTRTKGPMVEEHQEGIDRIVR